ncbi:Zinc finger, RING-type [Sesbania bispinosa]|nr:Zinc finger, RING-type [Sesbania bispinosa]
MSRNMNNFTPLPGLWRTGVRAYDAHTSNNSESNEVPVFYRSRSTRATDERSSGVLDSLQFWDVRTPTGHHSIPNFPAQQPHSRQQQTYVHNGDMGRGFNPRFRDIFLQPPLRSTHQTSTQVPPVVENSKSTVLSKLRKQVYNPTPKRLVRKLSLYYRDNAVKDVKERVKEKDEDGKRCAICLEDFEPKEEVMLTPCNHMFHEDCIVPWLTSKGQCPVCRFVICEKVRGNSSSFNRNDIANLEPSDLIAGELLSILRAMEEAFQLGSITY